MIYPDIGAGKASLMCPDCGKRQREVIPGWPAEDRCKPCNIEHMRQVTAANRAFRLIERFEA
jgi:hypothetical protein